MFVEECFDILDNPRELSVDEFREFREQFDGILHSFNEQYKDTTELIMKSQKVMAATPLRTKIRAYKKPFTDARNRMGCSENWYNSWYAIANTFSQEEIDYFSDETLEALDKLGDKISEALY